MTHTLRDTLEWAISEVREDGGTSTQIADAVLDWLGSDAVIEAMTIASMAAASHSLEIEYPEFELSTKPAAIEAIRAAVAALRK